MEKAMEKAIALVREYALVCGQCPQHWSVAKNYAIRQGCDKAIAKAAALYAVAHASELGIVVKKVPHGPRLSPADYFAGAINRNNRG